MPKGFREILVKNIRATANELLLDFGTGTAETAILIKKQMPAVNITGVDIDVNILNIAERKIQKEKIEIQLLAYDGCNLPFSNNYFDKIVSCLVFHHLSPDNKRQALSEIFRILKPGGKMYIADWGLERNKIKSRLLNVFKHFHAFKYIVEQGKGLLPVYIQNAGFKNVIETGYLKTITGTLCYYEAEK